MLLKVFIISTIFTVWYAWSRSMHDKHLFGSSDYRWHWWALQEAIVLNSLFIIVLIIFHGLGLFPFSLYKLFVLWFINASFFWIIFDMLMGYHAKKDIWYIGVTGYDAHVRKIFLYDKIKGKGYFVLKLIIYLILTCGLYFEVGIDSLFR